MTCCLCQLSLLPISSEILQTTMTALLAPGEWRGLEVAIKTVVFQSGKGDNQTALVASEAAIATNLVHRNIVSTFSHDIRTVAPIAGNELAVFKFYLIQEFCNGGTLRQALQKGYFCAFSPKTGAWRWEAIMQMLHGIASGMDYMHRQRICHGDLNPSNILLKVWLCLQAITGLHVLYGCAIKQPCAKSIQVYGLLERCCREDLPRGRESVTESPLLLRGTAGHSLQCQHISALSRL
jgi:serine/threonine protein kinase